MRGRRVKTRTVDGIEVTESTYFDAETLRANGLAAQLEWMLSQQSWVNVQTIDDVFNPRIVDDGVCSVTEFVIPQEFPSEGVSMNVTYHYWLARFGGNASGIFLRSLLTSNLFFCGEWEIVAHNIDDDLTWCGPGDVAWSLLEHLKSIAAIE